MRRAEIVAAIMMAVLLTVTFLVPRTGTIAFLKTLYYGSTYMGRGANNSIIFKILGDFKVEACSRSNHDYCKYPVDPA